MNIWHVTPDAPGAPRRVAARQPVTLRIGTWPIEPGQHVWLSYTVTHLDGSVSDGRCEAVWAENRETNSYWHAEHGPFAPGDAVTYVVHGTAPTGPAHGPTHTFRVGPQLFLALLWHQHQPVYKDTAHPTARGSYRYPWVRLHAIRDYYTMAARVAEQPDLHLTINLTPTLVWQLDDYVNNKTTDRALELTLTPAAALTRAEHGEILRTFFDAHWHNQIFPHPRYQELFLQRQQRRPFSTQDLRDLQMWFNLAWFGTEFCTGDVVLATGERASVRRFIDQARDFTDTDLSAMANEQQKILRAILPLHRHLQERGQIEVSTTPWAHPILPLLIDTDDAVVDRPDTTLPRRFAYPEDADAHVQRAIDAYARHFGGPPLGMWPAEGAVSQAVLPIFARAHIRWLATDQGVLARSGRWGYQSGNADVLCQPYRAEAGEHGISIFFRDRGLSDAIGFHYSGYVDAEQAASEFVAQIKARFMRQISDAADRILTVVLDGENAWGAYRDGGRPFLNALYRRLALSPELQTVSFAEYLAGDPARGIAAHPLPEQQQVHDLATGSWIDELGSAPGVDLGTWIGEAEENHAWELLTETRAMLAAAGVTPETAPDAFEALYSAEGSDWFWWFGADQESGNDQEFDDLFRLHLQNVYRSIGRTPPDSLTRHIVPHAAVWSFVDPIDVVQPGDRLTVRTNCPGEITWQLDETEPQTVALAPAGGVMAGPQRYHLDLGPFPPTAKALCFRFRCTHPDCDGRRPCCQPEPHVVRIAGLSSSGVQSPRKIGDSVARTAP